MGEEPGEMTRDRMNSAEPISSTDEATVMQAEIEQTRAEMSDTIDAIQDRLSPQHIVAQAKETVREATVGRIQDMVNSATETATGLADQVQDSAQQAIESVRDNPLPAALIGAGVAWLFMRSQRTRPMSRQTGTRQAGAYSQSSPSTRLGSARSDGWLDTVKENPLPAALAGVGLGWLAMNRRSLASRSLSSQRTWQPGMSTGRATQEAVGEAAEKVQETWQYYSGRAETEFDRWMRENPLTVGVAAIALGAAVGLTAPRTETEDALMGDAREALMDRAQEVAQDTVEQAQKVVDVAQSTVQGSPGSAARP
jgi:ElaB/YqjD/DUF883 family membrane-anchored ribosome-binding protein